MTRANGSPNIHSTRRARGVATLLALAILPCLASHGWTDDVVVVSRTRPPGESRRRGTIADYTGEALTLQLPGGREERIEPSRVLGYETEQVTDHKKGDRLFLEGRFPDAVLSYRRAVEIEQRRWMRRVILAQMVRCYTNMRQFVRAGDAFLLIVRSDPATQLLDAAPLTWSATAPPADLVERSTTWIEDNENAIVRLMGASWLLTTAHRQKALDVLGKLATSQDRRIAMLSETQLWRNQSITATMEDVRRWETQLTNLDASLRAGPYFLLGQSLARLGRHDAAALAFLRVPILHSAQRDLAAEALFAAGEQLEKMGDRGGARTVYKELVQHYENHQLTPLAQQRLQRAGTD